MLMADYCINCANTPLSSHPALEDSCNDVDVAWTAGIIEISAPYGSSGVKRDIPGMYDAIHLPTCSRDTPPDVDLELDDACPECGRSIQQRLFSHCKSGRL